jgi:competence protein ComEC
MLTRSLGHRAPLLWLVLPYAAGLILGKLAGWPLGWPLLACSLIPAAVAFHSSRDSPRAWSATIVIAMIAAGAASYSLHRVRIPSRDGLPAREARVSMRIERVFTQTDPRRATGLAIIRATGRHLDELVGQRVYFALTLRKGESPPLRSTILAASGVIVALPGDPPAGSFDGYLANAGINFRLTRGRIAAIEQPALAYYQFCARAGSFFHAVLGLGIEDKQPHLAALLRGMMLGMTHELSEEQQALFIQSGTMHLFAISGLNIGIIAAAIQTLLLLARLPPWARCAIGVVLLWLFVDITGASPSAVRAFAMTVCLQIAFVLHRPANLLAALIASAFCVLLVTPLQLFSASFLMSYSIVTALLVLGVPLGDRVTARWSPWRDLPKPAWGLWQHAIDIGWRWLSAALAIGIATTLVSVLTGVQFFQLLTPGSFATNLILIPAAGIVTLAGFAALLCGLVGAAPIATLMNYAAALTLGFIEAVVRLSVQVPAAFLPAQFHPAWMGGVALIALLTALLFGYATEWRLARGGWWPPFAIVALVLMFGMKFG